MSELSDLEELAGFVPEQGRRRIRHRGEFETHCKRGHALTPENVYVHRTAECIHRSCKKCLRLLGIGRGRHS